MTTKFDIYDKTEMRTSQKIVLALLILSGSFWFFISLLSLSDKYDFPKYILFGSLFISIILGVIYYIIKTIYKQFKPTGTIEFFDNYIDINHTDFTGKLQKSNLIKLTIYYDSYEGQAIPSLRGTDTCDGLNNLIFVSTKDFDKSFKFFVKNRGQILILQKLMQTWNQDQNIKILFTNRQSENCLNSLGQI